MARHGGHALTEAARAANPGQVSYWETKVDPDHQLPEAERSRRAGHARVAYFTGLAFKSSRARSRKKAAS